MTTKTLILINPAAGGRGCNGLEKELDGILCASGIRETCDIDFTAAGGVLPCAGRLAGYERILAAGGDGTVALIVQELAACEEPRPRLGIIPLGTGNDLARISGAYRMYKRQGLAALVPALLQGAVRKLDLFGINDKIYFTNYCGIGLDSKISNDYNLKRNRLFMRILKALNIPRAAYIYLAGANLFSRLPFSLELTCLDRRGQSQILTLDPGMRQILISGIPSYAAGARPSAACKLDDGLFEITVIETLRQWIVLHLTRFGPRYFSELLPGARQFQAGRCNLCFSGKIFFQADGELYAEMAQSCRELRIAHAGSIDLIFV